MLQPTSRRFLRELDEALRGNNLQYIYILQCPCILVSPFFGNQGLHNKIMLGGNGRYSRVMCEGSSYTHLSHTMTLLPLPSLVAWLTINTTVLPRTPVLLSRWTAIQAIKVIFFTIITRITSSRNEFSPPEMFPRHPVVDSSIPLEQQSSGCDHYYRNLIKIIQRISQQIYNRTPLQSALESRKDLRDCFL